MKPQRDTRVSKRVSKMPTKFGVDDYSNVKHGVGISNGDISVNGNAQRNMKSKHANQVKDVIKKPSKIKTARKVTMNEVDLEKKIEMIESDESENDENDGDNNSGDDSGDVDSDDDDQSLATSAKRSLRSKSNIIETTPAIKVKSKTKSRKKEIEVDLKEEPVEVNGNKEEKKSERKRKLVKSAGKMNLIVSKVKGKQVLSLAKEKLHASAVPESLPCREDEFEDIFNFVHSKLVERVGGCMYISGVPGTGKTATVYEVMKKLKDMSKLPKFKFLEINGLRLTDPYQCYVQLLLQLTGEKRSSQQAADQLNDYFSDPIPKSQFIILLVDELDLLRTRKQNVLYHLFDWPSRPYSNLIVLAIANAMDLPERLMINRVVSRLGLTRLSFAPYSFQELQEIISSRIKGLDCFDADAIQLICRKVAAVSGDARRVLDISRRSVEIAEMENAKSVAMSHVDKALNEMFNSIKLTAIRNASLHEKIFLKSVIQEFRISGVEEAVFINVFKHHLETCQLECHDSLSTSQLFDLAQHLSNMRLIILESKRCDLQRRIRLNASVDDVNFALKID